MWGPHSNLSLSYCHDVRRFKGALNCAPMKLRDTGLMDGYKHSRSRSSKQEKNCRIFFSFFLRGSKMKNFVYFFLFYMQNRDIGYCGNNLFFKLCPKINRERASCIINIRLHELENLSVWKPYLFSIHIFVSQNLYTT